jgi:hypothetical protein
MKFIVNYFWTNAKLYIAKKQTNVFFQAIIFGQEKIEKIKMG